MDRKIGRYSLTAAALGLLPTKIRTIAEQMSRYAIAGLGITLAVAASYWALAELGQIDPMISLAIVVPIFGAISYITHGSFSFRGHGERDRHHIRAGRFVFVALVTFLLNQFHVWLLVKQLGGPTWWPTIPMVLVTPLVTFVLLRRYVYN
ncbi:GtrA family protein [Sphingomonas sp. RB56-2]|uniref:GtrA family protein n=1 Tax=Sphingomonas brevis TaxID=2908206 RepID=A0ABT0SAH5_9SPHN|nr:GtrA family protein [Sphingomonas brevis]MCL6741399.1 GtrA family protein [Sphingomonas brevis]